MRDRAAGILRERYDTLDARAARRQLTDAERRELIQVAAAISELEAMEAGQAG